MLFVVGQATHFVQDLNQPLHAGWGETRAEHNEIEARMLYRSWQKDHTYRGFGLIRDYSCFAYQIARHSSQHTRALFFDLDIKRVTELAWDQAVNDTANLWAVDLVEYLRAGAGGADVWDPCSRHGCR